MKSKIPLSILILLVLSISVYSVQTGLYTPPDNFYWIIGGVVMANNTFTVNATPLGTGLIKNVTLYSNVSGSWTNEYVNNTAGTAGAKVTRIFLENNTGISTATISDGMVFIWNAYSCDNASIFDNEPVMLSGGKGGLSNYPVSSVRGIMNDTGTSVGTGACNLTASTGRLSCNQTSGVSELLTPIILVNYTLSSTCRYAGANRTVYVEDAPAITINAPATSSYSTSENVNVNITVVGDSASYQCEIYSNDTGTWGLEGNTPLMLNNTSAKFQKQFTEGNVVLNSKCWEIPNSNIYGWATSNVTITVDTTVPVISLTSPTSGSSQSTTLYFNGTVTEINLQECRLFINKTNTDWGVLTNYNESTTVFIGSNLNFTSKVFADGDSLKWGVWCNDSAGLTAWSSNYTVNLYSGTPSLTSSKNYTSSTADDTGFTVEFIFSEAVNATFKYGLTSMSQTNTARESDYDTNQTFTLTFNDNYETNYYCNITFCDRSNNCNNTIPELIIKTPVPLKSGWTLWSVYDSSIDLSRIESESGADYVYWWNATSQAWKYYSATTNADLGNDYGIHPAVWLYSTSGTTWFRNNSGTASFDYNITSGHNFLPMYFDYTFGNLSHNLFRNSSGGNVTDITSPYGAGGVGFSIEDYAGYNNSAQEWNLFYYTWDTANTTELGKNYKNGIDALWFYSQYNVTLNVTPNGQIFANWTR
jgi:hypothetical protein